MLPAQRDIQKAEIYRWVETSYTAIGRVVDEFSEPTFAEFRTLATQVIANAKQRYYAVGNAIPWLALPLATAEAVKAAAPAAAQIGAGFELARMAAGILDQCIDQDTQDALWMKIGIGPTMTLANGLTCLSLLAVSQLSALGVSVQLASRIRTEFELTWLRMCEAQQKELAIARDGDIVEETYWDIARGKSGCFFELGCKAAAMLAPDMNSDVLDGYAGYGRHIGVMLQLINDLRGMWGVDGKKDIGKRLTLPIIYARAALSDEKRFLLDRLLADAANDESATTAAREIIEFSGALQYTLIQIQLYRDRAERCLAVCEDPSIFLQMLNAFLPLKAAAEHGNAS